VASRYHWYARLVGVGNQVPGEAVSTDPTRAVPAIVGTGDAVKFTVVTVGVATLVLWVVA
jgi:hypothetical protein